MFALKGVVLLIICAYTQPPIAQVPSRMSDDLSHRDASIHWPRAFDPLKASVFAHNELEVQADCHRVWSRLVDLPDWPSWFVLTKDVVIEGSEKTVGHGSFARLRIFNSPITLRIDEDVPDSRLSWFPKSSDEASPSHYHSWHLVPSPGGCRVITEETGIGPNDMKAPESNSRLIHKAHDLWLASLRWTSER